MPYSLLPTDLLISAHIRIAAKENIPIVIRQRGDNDNGSLMIKINLLNGTARLLTQTRYEDEVVWCPISNADPMPEPDSERAIERQMATDPDSWVVEIEDKLGRVWFPGRVMIL